MGATLKSLEKELEITLEDFNLVGRSPDASIRLVDGGVSRQHATIRRDGQLFWVSDLGSANGSFVNDVAVTTARALRHGDRVQFGTSTFVFDSQDEERPPSESGNVSTQSLHTIALPVKTVRATLLVGLILCPLAFFAVWMFSAYGTLVIMLVPIAFMIRQQCRNDRNA